MQKKGFSLLEILFVLVIITVIITVAVSKFDTAFTKTNITKIKSDILQIRAGITLTKNKMILKNLNETLAKLDDNNEMLFNLILDTPIVATTSQEKNHWTKESETTYKVYIEDSFLLFNYDTSNFTFNCDISNTLCKELNL